MITAFAHWYWFHLKRAVWPFPWKKEHTPRDTILSAWSFFLIIMTNHLAFVLFALLLVGIDFLLKLKWD